MRIRCCSCVLQIRLRKANKRKFAFCLDVFASVSCAGASVTQAWASGRSHEPGLVLQCTEQETSVYKAEEGIINRIKCMRG